MPMTVEDRAIAKQHANFITLDRYAHADRRDADSVYNRLDWRAKSVIGARVTQQVTAQISQAHDYGDDKAEGIFAVY